VKYILTLVFLAGLAHAEDFDAALDVKAVLIQAKAEAGRDRSQPTASAVEAPPDSKSVVIKADGGDGYVLSSKGEVSRVINKYKGLFDDRIGPLEGASDVVSIASFQDRLLAVQKNGRVFIFCADRALKGIWAVIAVDMSSLEVKDSRLYAVGRNGQRYVYTGDLRSATGLGLKSSLINFWLPPSVVFGNSIHDFKKVSSR
jgi:hypothetical protein